MDNPVVEIERDSKFQISYTHLDGTTSSFKCSEEFADLVMDMHQVFNKLGELIESKVVRKNG